MPRRLPIARHPDFAMLAMDRAADDTSRTHRAESLCQRLQSALLALVVLRIGNAIMGKKFKVGDHVSWNSEAGRVSGVIVKVHAKDVNYKGYVHHANRDDPQYEIKSDKTDHVALHKGRALRLLQN